MEITLSAELEGLIREEVGKGVAPSVEAFVEKVVRGALGFNGDNRETPRHERPISEVILENMRDTPEEELAKLPRDGSSQVDHYLYGHPKR